MNQWIGIGRLVKTPELKKTKSEKSMCNFTVAVERKYKSADGERMADFINCTCFGQQADFLTGFFVKGSRVGITGTVQSRTYEDTDGKRMYVTEIMCENFEFIDLKKDNANQGNAHSNISEGIPASSREKIEGLLPPEVKDDIYPDFGGDGLLPFDL